jgi:hypothetical protein
MTMNVTQRRLGLSLLFTAAVIIFNVYMVLTGAAGDLYDHLTGTVAVHAESMVKQLRETDRADGGELCNGTFSV